MSFPFSPPSISTLVLWLDASDPATLVTNGTSVVQWRDKTMFQNHTTLSSPTAPVLSTINGLSSVYFNSQPGISQYFQGPLTTGLSSFTVFSSSFYIFAVATMPAPVTSGYNRNFITLGSNTTRMDGLFIQQFQQPSTLTVAPNLLTVSSATTNYIRNIVSSVSGNAWFTYQSMANSPAPLDRPFQAMMAFTRSNSFSFLSVDGGMPMFTGRAGATLTNLTANRYAIASGNLTGDSDARLCWNGSFGEILIYNLANVSDAMSLQQIQEIQGYLASKWGLQSNLAPYHPYRRNPIQLSTILSAQSVDLTSASKVYTLPSSTSLSSQMIWLTANTTLTSTCSLLPQMSDTVNRQFSSNLQLDPQTKAIQVVNTTTSNWILQSKFKGAVSNLHLVPYTYFPPLSTIGRGTGDFAAAIAVNSNSTYFVAGNPFNNSTFVFSKDLQSDTWVYRQVFRPSDSRAGDRTGDSICMSYDGTYILEGSPSNQVGPAVTDVGACYMFKKDPVSDLWFEVQKLLVSDSQVGTLIGYSNRITMTQDATYIAMGSPFFNTLSPVVTDAGTVYLFKKDPTTDFWSQIQQLYLPLQTITGRFGESVSFSADGTYLAAGARQPFIAVRNGSAYIFKKDPTSDLWTYVQGLQRGPGYQNNLITNFGSVVALSGDGNYVLVSCGTSDTECHLFKKRTTTDYFDWIQELSVPNRSQFGSSLCLSFTGEYILLAGNSLGSTDSPVYLFKKQPTTDFWIAYPTSNFISTLGTYGFSIAMDSACDSFYVGAESLTAFQYKQSTLRTIPCSNSFLTINTQTQKDTILLPPASENPGGMFWIKHTGGNPAVYPVSLSTPYGTTMLSNVGGLFFSQGNFSAQFQSDGVSNYNLVNYFDGTLATVSSSVYIWPFSIQKNSVSFTSTGVFRFPLQIVNTSGFERDTTTGLITLPMSVCPSYSNLYFKGPDNQTILPHWFAPYNGSSNWVFIRSPGFFPWQTLYMYLDSNTIATQKPYEVFDLFDDFTNCPGGVPDTSRWSVELKGGGTASQNTDGFMVLQGANSVASSANLISKLPILYGNQGVVVGVNETIGMPTVTENSNVYFIQIGYLCTDVVGTVVSVGIRPSLQDGTGGQTNWGLTTLTEGATYYSSNLTSHWGYRPSTGIAVVTGQSNTTTQFAPSNTWQTLEWNNARIFQGNSATSLFSNAPVNQRFNQYLHIGQTNAGAATAPKLYLAYVAATNVLDSLFNTEIFWGKPNILTIS